MNEKLKLFIALLVLACSNNVKVVYSQINGFGYLTPGNTFTLPTSYGWHNNANGGISFGNSDVYRPYTRVNFPSHAFDTNSNSDDSTLSSKSVHEDVKAILAEIENNKWSNDAMKHKFDHFKPLNTQIVWKNSEESEIRTKRSTSTRSTTTGYKWWTTTRYTTTPHTEVSHNYGLNTFVRKKLTENTYIAKNDFFENQPPLGPGPLAKALFSSGYEWAFSGPYDTLNNKRWNKYEDKRWRETTRGPYFENKIPGENKIIPASAVVGAATAFGLVTLLPLAVPRHEPLMYCGNTNLNQLAVQINDKNIYTCNENSFEIVCKDNFRNQLSYQCMNKKIPCDLKYDEIEGNIYCRNGTLFSKTNIFCISTATVAGRINTMTILECYEGNIDKKNFASFIPTTTLSPYLHTTTTTVKPLSFAAKAHMFMLKLMGKFEVLEEETPSAPEIYRLSSFPVWYPEALTIPPETTTTKDDSDSESAEASKEIKTKSISSL